MIPTKRRNYKDQSHRDSHLNASIEQLGRAVASALVGRKSGHEGSVVDVVFGLADNDKKGTGVESTGANWDGKARVQLPRHSLL